MNDHLRRALDALETGATEARRLYAASDVRARLRRTAEEILEHLEAEENAAGDPDDIFDRLDRQSRDIAEDLRRADRLMKRRTGQG